MRMLYWRSVFLAIWLGLVLLAMAHARHAMAAAAATAYSFAPSTALHRHAA